jgi:GxxExxY protein
MQKEYKHQELTSLIIKCFYDVYNALGYGFLEKVYEQALKLELKKYELAVEQQKPIKVYYDNIAVGEYFADLIINDTIIIEVKASNNLCEEHELQLINYLKASDIEIGLLLNFGKKPEIKRKIFSKEQ